jgi:hypothetical protein
MAAGAGALRARWLAGALHTRCLAHWRRGGRIAVRCVTVCGRERGERRRARYVRCDAVYRQCVRWQRHGCAGGARAAGDGAWTGAVQQAAQGPIHSCSRFILVGCFVSPARVFVRLATLVSPIRLRCVPARRNFETGGPIQATRRWNTEHRPARLPRPGGGTQNTALLDPPARRGIRNRDGTHQFSKPGTQNTKGRGTHAWGRVQLSVRA